MERKRLLTIGQAAKVLGISPSTLRVYADKGDVPCVKLPSGYRRFDPDDIERIALGWVSHAIRLPGDDPREGDEPTEPAPTIVHTSCPGMSYEADSTDADLDDDDEEERN